MEPSASAQALETALDAEREATSARINPLRLGVVGLLWALVVGLGYGAGQTAWRAGTPSRAST